MRTPTPRQQSGFTLVEIAIVLVIIGLLLGGVLKGAELIENSKVRKATSELNGSAAAYYSYQDRFGRIPGDDGPTATLTARGSSWTGVNGGNNNGNLVVNLNQTWNGGGENQEFWQHLKAAGFITGNPTDTGVNALPRNAFGGLIGVTTQAMGNGLNGIKICLSQVPGKGARTLDTQLDDGLGTTGKIRATLGASGANTNPTNAALAAAYSEDQVYTICMQI